MKKILSISIYLFFLSAMFLSTGCKKEEPVPEEEIVEFKYDSLYFEGEVLLNETEEIHAIASGKNLVYNWTIDLGVLLGSGNTVTFTACCQGFHNISCTVEDAYGNSATKSVLIKVI